jgi:hypothetical protein
MTKPSVPDTVYKGETRYDSYLIYILRQVEDFAHACNNNEATAKEIYNIIGAKLKLPNKKTVIEWVQV